MTITIPQLQNSIVNQDCRAFMRSMPADSIDVAMTSPPYWALRDYKVAPSIWGGKQENSCRHEWVGYVRKGHDGGMNDPMRHRKGSANFQSYSSQAQSVCSVCGAWEGQLGMEPSPKMYIDHLMEVFRELRRVLKPSGTFYLNIGDTYGSGGAGGDYAPGGLREGQPKYKQESSTRSAWLQPKQLLGIPERVMIAMQDDGWILRNKIIWHKPNSMPESVKDRLTNVYEVIYLFAKTRRYWFDLDSIREPLAASSIERISQPTVFQQAGGPKQDALRGSPARGNGSRCNLMVQSLARRSFNRRVRDVATGHIYGGAWKASEAEVQAYKGKFKDVPSAGASEPFCFRARNLRTKGIKRNAGAPIVGGEHGINKNGHSGYFSAEGNLLVSPDGKNPGDTWKYNVPHSCTIWKSSRAGENPNGKNPGDVWAVTTRPYSGAHFATFPPKLCVRPILASCPPGGIVFDPFAGSGTTLAVAKVLGRDYLGCEVSPEYLTLIRARLQKLEKPFLPITKVADGMKAVERIR